MLNDYLPNKIDPFKAAGHRAQLHGALKIREMQRLVPSLHSDEGEIEVSMEFGKDEQGIFIVRVHLKGSLILQCQRCMKPFNYGIMREFMTGIVTDEKEAANLPEEYEAVVVTEGVLIIQDMIEDELIVELPLVPMHDLTGCGATLPLVAGSGEPLEKENPFNVISILRSKTDSKKE